MYAGLPTQGDLSRATRELPGVARQLTTQLGQRNTVSAYARYGFYYSTHSCCQSLRPDSLAPPNILLLRVIMTAMPVALWSRHHRFHGRRCHVHVHGHVRAFVSSCRGALGLLRQRQGRVPEAEALYTEVLQAQIACTRPDHPDALKTTRRLTALRQVGHSPPAALPDPSSPNYAAVYYGTYRTTTSS